MNRTNLVFFFHQNTTKQLQNFRQFVTEITVVRDVKNPIDLVDTVIHTYKNQEK